MFWLFRLLKFVQFSVMKGPNWLFLHRCLIPKLYLVKVLLFDYDVFGTKLRLKIKKLRNKLCYFVIIFLFLKTTFWLNGFTSTPFPTYVKIGSFFMTIPVLIIFRNYFLLVFDHVFVGCVYLFIYLFIYILTLF